MKHKFEVTITGSIEDEMPGDLDPPIKGEKLLCIIYEQLDRIRNRPDIEIEEGSCIYLEHNTGDHLLKDIKKAERQ